MSDANMCQMRICVRCAYVSGAPVCQMPVCSRCLYVSDAPMCQMPRCLYVSGASVSDASVSDEFVSDTFVSDALVSDDKGLSARGTALSSFDSSTIPPHTSYSHTLTCECIFPGARTRGQVGDKIVAVFGSEMQKPVFLHGLESTSCCSTCPRS